MMNKKGGILVGFLFLIASIILVIIVSSAPAYLTNMQSVFGYIIALVVSLIGVGQMMRGEDEK